MASIVKRRRKDGTPSYYVKYVAGDGRTRWEQFASAKEARARKAAVEVELGRSAGTWTPPVPMTFQTVAEAWLDRRRHALRPGTVRNYRVVLDAHLLPRFGYMKVAAIRPSDAEAFRAEMAARGKGRNTIRNVLGVLRQILGELVVDGHLVSNPVDGLAHGKRPGRPPRKIEVPSASEVEALVHAARPEARPVFELAASTGLRRSELLALR